MDTFTIKWSGPHNLTTDAPSEEWGKNGVYIVLQNANDVVYVGMAGAKKGAVSEARYHRGKYIQRRKMRGLGYDESKAMVYAGHIDNWKTSEQVEGLLIAYLYCGKHGSQMVNSQKLYYKGEPLRILNEKDDNKEVNGGIPPCLPHEIQVLHDDRGFFWFSAY
jgi:hypothetical protein